MALSGPVKDRRASHLARILVVEENPADVERVEQALARGRILHEMHVLESGTAALPYLQNLLGNPTLALPDLILLDLDLPDEGGRAVLEAIRTEPSLRHLPIIVLTTSAERVDALQACDLQINATIIKPVNVDNLLEALRQVRDFWLHLVIVPSGWQDPRLSSTATSPGHRQGIQRPPLQAPPIQVLIVEDNPADAELIRIFLEDTPNAPFDVQVVGRASEAIHLLGTRGDVDVLLLDLSLPDSSGLDTLFRFRQLPMALPIIILTGLDDEELALRAVQSGAQDYLLKSDVTPPVLLKAIQYAIERSGFEERLRQAEKMEAIGRLAGGVAHDFNNMLAVILGYCEVLLASTDLEPDQLTSFLQEILEAGERAKGLTRQLLTFGRKQAVTLQTLDLNEVVVNLQRMLRSSIREDIVLETRLVESLPSVRADAGQLEQVLMNLVINARDALNGGGLIGISTTICALPDRTMRRHPDLPPGSYVRLSVSDNGTGMTEEVRSRIFEPFFTTKELGQGTGLGLATVHAIARQSGGCVEAESRPGEGSTFHFYLPVAETPVKTAPVPDDEQLLRGTETVLVVEDEILVLSIVSLMLGSAGYKVLKADSAVAALQVSDGHKLDLLLTDVVMPGVGGRELADRLCDRQPGLTVLFMSGYTDDEILRDRFLGPQRAFIPKPFKPRQLLSKVRQVLDGAKAASTGQPQVERK